MWRLLSCACGHSLLYLLFLAVLARFIPVLPALGFGQVFLIDPAMEWPVERKELPPK